MDVQLEGGTMRPVRHVRHVRAGCWGLPVVSHRYLDSHRPAATCLRALQVPGWRVGEVTSRHRWLPPIESFAKRSLI